MEMKYMDFVLLVVEYSNLKHEFLKLRDSGEYKLREERRVSKRMGEVFGKICDVASFVFDGGKKKLEIPS